MQGSAQERAKQLIAHSQNAEAKKVLHQAHLNLTEKATKRVIAPYVKIIRKGQKQAQEVEESKQFSFYLQKKPSVLLRDLSSFLSDSVDLPSLLHETADVLKNVTKATGVTLYMVDSAVNEIYQSQKTFVSDRHKIRWKIDEGTIVAAFVANRREYVMVEDVLRDERFPEGIGYMDVTIKSVLCVPVVTPDGDCFAVIELYRQLTDQPFQNEDLKITIVVTGWMGAAIHQNQQRLALQRQQELNDYLLELTKCYFADSVLMEKMISEVVVVLKLTRHKAGNLPNCGEEYLQHDHWQIVRTAVIRRGKKFAKATLGAERGSFFVIDKDSDELVADLFDEGLDGQDTTLYKKSTKIRFGKERGIAGLVAKTGVTVNIKDAYNDPRFNKEVDQKTGFITRSILCMPISSVDGVLGVVQVVNKKNGGCFTSTDENLFKTFSVYCALALHYTKAHINNVFTTLLKLQLRPCLHDVDNFIKKPTVTIPESFDQFHWYIGVDMHDEMPQLALYMFTQLVDPSHINISNLMKFILSARKLYRKNPYHNFEHAFNVCHCMYLILLRNMDKFSDIEVKALVLSALLHDVDHPGFTNNFLQLVNDDIAQLYDESILENHHYKVTMLLLSEYKVYPKLDENEYKIFSKECREAILATDLALYFKSRGKVVQICNENSFDFNNCGHKTLLKAMMMTSCDLSGQCKPFVSAKRITDCLYREFYAQGDREKAMGLCPLSIMDREKQHTVPEDQVQFLTVVVLPCVDLLRNILPNTGQMYEECMGLRNNWQEIIEVRGKKCWKQEDSVVHD